MDYLISESGQTKLYPDDSIVGALNAAYLRAWVKHGPLPVDLLSDIRQAFIEELKKRESV